MNEFNSLIASGQIPATAVFTSIASAVSSGVLTGDLKAGSITVAAGARMRGQVEFGWDDGKGSKLGKQVSEHFAETGTA